MGKKIRSSGRGGSGVRRARAAGASAGGGEGVQGSLLRSQVYRRVPVAERVWLDEAIVRRPAGCGTLDEIAVKFQLDEKYGVSIKSLRGYARKVEQLVRPRVTSDVMAGLMGCLPETYRRQIVKGGQVMLISRIVRALDLSSEALTVAELVRLGTALLALSGQSRAVGRKGRQGAEHGGSKRASGEVAALDPIKMAESVRLLYGLSWPPTESGGNAQDGELGSR